MEPEKRSILVVDDEAHIRHVLTLKLENAGYEVLTAGDGEEALELAQQRSVHLVITDHQMPCMNGLTLCRELRSRETTAQIPCIMLTARGFQMGAEEIDQTNIAVMLSKPFSPREILDRVRELTEGVAPAEATKPSEQEVESGP